MKIIFLDIDGVLNHQLWSSTDEFKKRCKRKNKNDVSCWFCPQSVDYLNTIIKETDAKIVVSSSWRLGRTIEELKKLLADNNIIGEVIGKTPHLLFKNLANYHYSVPRGCEIKAWLETHKSILEEKISKAKYVILDDDSDMLYWQRNNYIQIDSYCGITPSTILKAINILGKNKLKSKSE